MGVQNVQEGTQKALQQMGMNVVHWLRLKATKRFCEGVSPMLQGFCMKILGFLTIMGPSGRSI